MPRTVLCESRTSPSSPHPACLQLAACSPPLLCSYVLIKQGTAKAQAIVIAVLKGEVKTALGLISEAFDFAGDTAIFVAIQEDAQNPIFKARVATIIVPVRANDGPACRQAVKSVD